MLGDCYCFLENNNLQFFIKNLSRHILCEQHLICWRCFISRWNVVLKFKEHRWSDKKPLCLLALFFQEKRPQNFRQNQNSFGWTSLGAWHGVRCSYHIGTLFAARRTTEIVLSFVGSHRNASGDNSCFNDFGTKLKEQCQEFYTVICLILHAEERIGRVAAVAAVHSLDNWIWNYVVSKSHNKQTLSICYESSKVLIRKWK